MVRRGCLCNACERRFPLSSCFLKALRAIMLGVRGICMNRRLCESSTNWSFGFIVETRSATSSLSSAWSILIHEYHNSFRFPASALLCWPLNGTTSCRCEISRKRQSPRFNIKYKHYFNPFWVKLEPPRSWWCKCEVSNPKLIGQELEVSGAYWSACPIGSEDPTSYET